MFASIGMNAGTRADAERVRGEDRSDVPSRTVAEELVVARPRARARETRTSREGRTVASGSRLVVDCALERRAASRQTSSNALDRIRCRTGNRRIASCGV